MARPKIGHVKVVLLSHKRTRGRPPKIPLNAVDPETAQVAVERDKTIAKDAILKQLAINPDSLDLLDKLMLGAAEEAAVLKFERMEAGRKGNDVTSTSAKRLSSIKIIADLAMKKRDSIVHASLDFTSKPFQKLYEFFIMKVIDAAHDSEMDTDVLQEFLSCMEAQFQDWETEAELFIQQEDEKVTAKRKGASKQKASNDDEDD